MKTDSIFFQIFKTDPGILFELLGQSPDLAQDYEFSSVEIKQLAFRIDGVFLPKPDSNDQTVWFVEVQFGRDPKFYQEALQEGEQAGEQRSRTEEAQSLILRQLSRRVGTLPAGVEAQVQTLDLPRLEALGEALLDFTGMDDLVGWLETHSQN